MSWLDIDTVRSCRKEYNPFASSQGAVHEVGTHCVGGRQEQETQIWHGKCRPYTANASLYIYTHEKQTWNLKIPRWNSRNIYKPPIFGFHVCFQWCNYICNDHHGIYMHLCFARISQGCKHLLATWFIRKSRKGHVWS